ncbi:MAG: hypothetical protein B7X02_02870 [Rhodospirillales bacterium 12-54-5]|nr:MAG: hypothetical protein B7X02_02870 [Rhodospirillales bacterium 12-54-5]
MTHGASGDPPMFEDDTNVIKLIHPRQKAQQAPVIEDSTNIVPFADPRIKADSWWVNRLNPSNVHDREFLLEKAVSSIQSPSFLWLENSPKTKALLKSTSLTTDDLLLYQNKEMQDLVGLSGDDQWRAHMDALLTADKQHDGQPLHTLTSKLFQALQFDNNFIEAYTWSALSPNDIALRSELNNKKTELIEFYTEHLGIPTHEANEMKRELCATIDQLLGQYTSLPLR